MAEGKPIFYDEQRRRWRRTRLALEIAGSLFTLVLVVFLANVVRNPELPDLLRPDVHEGLHAVPAKLKHAATRRSRKHKVAALGHVPQSYDPLRAAFYVSDDYTSLASLQLHYHDLDLLIPEALHAISADGKLVVDQDLNLAAFLRGLQKRTPPIELPVMPMVNNYDAVTNEWCPPGFLKMLADPIARTRMATQLEDYADAEHEAGIVVDFESLPRESQKDFQAFVHDLSVDLH